MNIYDGSVSDKSNFSSDKYLQVNSCGYQNVISDCRTIRRNGRKDYHILLLVDGEGEAYHNGTFHTIKKGDLVIYAPNEKQEYSYTPGTTAMWAHFCGKIIPEVFSELNITSGIYDVSGNNFIYTSFTNMIRNFHRSERIKFSNSDLLELLYNIANSLGGFCPDKYSELITPVLTYINANYNKKITVSSLAEKTNYSKSRFLHIFSFVTGTTPIKYQNDLRLKIACEFLQSSNLTVQNIAFSLGFNDPLYFSRLFKKKYNISPENFRKNSIK